MFNNRVIARFSQSVPVKEFSKIDQYLTKTSHRRRPHDCTSLSSWNVRAPGGTTCCVFTAQWSVQSWGTPARCGTQVSLSRRRRHLSRYSAQRCASSMKTTRRWLYDVADSSRTRHVGVAARTTDRALLQAQRAAKDVVSALSAPGQAWRLRHRQTPPCKNIGTFNITDCWISKFLHTILPNPLYLGPCLVLYPSFLRL